MQEQKRKQKALQVKIKYAMLLIQQTKLEKK